MFASDVTYVLRVLAEACHRPADHPLEDLHAMIDTLAARPVDPLTEIAEVGELWPTSG